MPFRIFSSSTILGTVYLFLGETTPATASIKTEDKYVYCPQNSIDAVPNELVDDLFLMGSKERIRERLGAWRDAAEYRHVDTMIIDADQPEVLEFIAEELL